jgi:cytochrome b involved in lipid metabolism
MCQNNYNLKIKSREAFKHLTYEDHIIKLLYNDYTRKYKDIDESFTKSSIKRTVYIIVILILLGNVVK